jgi:ATP-dependent DNA helicase RecQ
MSENILCTLGLSVARVPTLSSRVRTSLIAYLVRWQHYNAAELCLQELLIGHSHHVSVYDNLARVYLAQGQPERALEIMSKRHALRVSSSSRALEAHAHLAAGDIASAQVIAGELIGKHPDLLLSWSLQADVRLAAGDTDGAEAAWRERETLQSDTAASAEGMARVWQERGDLDKALLWARTAVARTMRDERTPTVSLLCLLESLYRATGQEAQAEATAEQLQQHQEKELDELRHALSLELGTAEIRLAEQPTRPLMGQRPVTTAEPAPGSRIPEIVTGAMDLGPDERARLDERLRRTFGHDAFRPGQADVIATVLRGQSALAVMPTGAGKSLCYQLAAQLLPGTTLIISPLIALMKDQLDGLPASVAAAATTLNSTLDGDELRARLSRAAAGKYKMLYAAPERLRQRPFLHALKRAGVSLLVVDEAHCVSLWGHDFRPDYLFIAKAWHELGQPPILAMTATATPRVRDDIQGALGRMRLIASDGHRPNLRLEVRHFATDEEKQRALLAACHELEGSGIIYANARKKCEELASMLYRNGVSAIHYHAGIEDRAAAQDRFMSDRARVVVATIAFGMGVDKSNVRFIVHYNPPKTLENYYQEAGRAGRDGLPAHCILFHTPGDKATLTRHSRQDALQIEFLREVYANLKQRLGAQGVGAVTVGDLERDLVADETDLRVVIHFLETAGLLWRGFDLPRTAVLTLMCEPDGRDADFARFIEAARLRPEQTVSRDLLSLSREAELDPQSVEAQLLAWDQAGWLQYQGIGRDMLLALPKPPPDSQQRVTAMLADYRAGQDARTAEIVAYATTELCRHGHISAYFGGRAIERCQACDNCLRTAPSGLQFVPRARPAPRPAASPQPIPRPAATGEPATIILQGVAQLPFPLGRSGLARALKGQRSSSVQADRFPLFGALADRTCDSISELAAQLVEEGLLAYYDRGGYRLLRLTEKGQAWLEAPWPLTSLAPSPPRAKEPTEYDRALFAQLRAWRLEKAKEMCVPPYVIFHDSVLKSIATSRPTSLGELAAIKGIGPRKLEQYGSAVLGIVNGDEPKTRA